MLPRRSRRWSETLAAKFCLGNLEQSVDLPQEPLLLPVDLTFDFESETGFVVLVRHLGQFLLEFLEAIESLSQLEVVVLNGYLLVVLLSVPCEPRIDRSECRWECCTEGHGRWP